MFWVAQDSPEPAAAEEVAPENEETDSEVKSEEDEEEEEESVGDAFFKVGGESVFCWLCGRDSAVCHQEWASTLDSQLTTPLSGCLGDSADDEKNEESLRHAARCLLMASLSLNAIVQVYMCLSDCSLMYSWCCVI